MADDQSGNEYRDRQTGNLGPNGSVSLDTVVQTFTQEYENIDQTLDEIDSWMNKIEEQNDNLSAELDDLLESSKQARRELQEINKQKQEEEKNEEEQMETNSSNSNSDDNEKQS